MAADENGVTPESRSRVNLALSILTHRAPTPMACELAVLALRGATVGEVADFEASLRASAGAA